MNRRHFLASSVAALVAGRTRLLAQPPPAPAPAQPPAPPQPKWSEVRGSVGIFMMQGGTIGYHASPEGVVVIDSQYPQTAPVFLEGIKTKSPHAIDLLINTHHHADHTGGNKAFQPLVTHIVAHERVPALQKTAAEAAKTEANQAYADTTFSKDWKTTIGKETVSAMYYGPGHTGGDSVIFFERANVVHMGDLMFNRIHPRVDRAAGASIQNWITILEQVPKAHAADTIYIFGHGRPDAGVTGAADALHYFRGYLSAVLDYTRKQMQAGQSKEEITKTEALPGFESVATLTPALSLAGVLGVAFDELSAGK
jgi:glyoxylase-like metal-dependent hydrolase (beta-lactamase superfamily II)